MNNLTLLWKRLNIRQRVIVIGAGVIVFLLVLGLSRLVTRQDMALLYAGLDGAAAGEVVTALEQRGIAFEVRGNAIHVPERDRDRVRMSLAAEGLPSAGAAGYELLDGLSGFGTTSQMFDAAYWRAREGELARTILAGPDIRAARVHIAQGDKQAFREQSPATASVTVTTVSGGLVPAQARAIQHLVAAAVTGMQAENVAVIDTVGGLVSVREDGNDLSADVAERAGLLRNNVVRLLEARVGRGNAVVEIALDTITDTEQITERKFDPQGRVAISTDTQEKTGRSGESSGEVTVASNLPEGDAAGSAGIRDQSSETRERVNFEVSETRRELLRAPGAIRRLTVAVLVNAVPVTGADGAITWETRSDTELSDLRELVASAVGFDEARGDVLTLKSLPFDVMTGQGVMVSAGFWPITGQLDAMKVIQFLVLAGVVLVLGLFVIRPILVPRNMAQLAADPARAMLSHAGGDAADDAAPQILSGEIEDTDASQVTVTASALDEDPVSRLQRLIEERQGETVEVLRGWLETEEKT